MNEQIHTSRSAVSSVRPRVAKVPRVTISFWIVKILTTAVGEATSDYLVHRFNPYFAVIGGFAVFSIAMLIQFAVSGFVPWAYWFAVAMVAVFGTMAADVLHVEFGVPYIVSTVFFALALAILFVAWYRSEGTLSIHSVNSRRREVFYWAAVLATFAMGTAAGDLAAYTARLGFLSAGLLFAVVFAIPAVAYRYFNANPILMFWFAYITTRPLGASFADWLGKARTAGGLGVGDGPVTAVLTVSIVAFVVYFTLSGNGRQAAAASALGEPAGARVAGLEPDLGEEGLA